MKAETAPVASPGLPEPFYVDESVTLYHGDCAAVLPTLPANSINTVITDPPYGLNFMGKAWDHGVPGAEIWRQVLRVCKPGAFLLAFGGTRTFHRLTVAIEDGGWQIRDCICWLYGQGFPKSLDISKALDKSAGAEREVVGRRTDRAATPKHDIRGGRLMSGVNGGIDCSAITAPSTDAAKLWNGWGTALKPAWEPIIVAMKPLDGTFAQNAVKHGVAGLNIDGGRIPLNGDYKCRANGRPSLTSLGDNYDPTTANQPDTIGRFPANIILDEQASVMLDEMSESLHGAGVSRSGGAVQSGDGGMFGFGNHSGNGMRFGDSGGASRFFYTAKASRSDRGAGNHHPTVKPTDLLKYLCKLTATPTGGTILDPFVGSGTTLVAAREYGRPAIGIELDEDHCRIVIDRLRHGVLFPATSPTEAR